MSLRVHTSVLDEMRKEARRFSIETGGILVGPDDDTIAELIPSGRAAYRTHSEYELDTEHLQPLLDSAQRRGLRFLGVWHVHPEGCRDLSQTDLETARRMLRDRSYGMRRVLMPLTIRTGSRLETQFFLVEGNMGHVKEVCVLAIHDDGNPQRTSSSQWTESSSSGSYSIKLGTLGERLVRERRGLEESGWAVTLRECDRSLVLRAARADLVLCAVCPAEYPINPPDVYVETSEGLEPIDHSGIPETQVWSSERSLVTVIDQAARSVQSARDVRTHLQSSRLSRLLRAAAAQLIWSKEHVH